MIKLLKKYGVELKLKKCDLFCLIEGQKDTFLEDGFAFKMTNEEEMFKYFEARRTKVFYSKIRAMCRFYGKKNVRKYKKL